MLDLHLLRVHVGLDLPSSHPHSVQTRKEIPEHLVESETSGCLELWQGCWRYWAVHREKVFDEQPQVVRWVSVIQLSGGSARESAPYRRQMTLQEGHWSYPIVEGCSLPQTPMQLGGKNVA